MRREIYGAALCIALAPLLTWAEAPAVKVDIKLSPAGSFQAATKKVEGFAYKTADGIAAENVLIDMRTLKTGIALRDKHTHERLMVEKFPQAKLIKATGKEGKGEALIEIKGKRESVKGTYKIVDGALQAQFPLQLSDLEIKDVRYMGVGVKDDVIINITLPLRAPARASANVK